MPQIRAVQGRGVTYCEPLVKRLWFTGAGDRGSLGFRSIRERVFSDENIN